MLQIHQKIMNHSNGEGERKKSDENRRRGFRMRTCCPEETERQKKTDHDKNFEIFATNATTRKKKRIGGFGMTQGDDADWTARGNVGS